MTKIIQIIAASTAAICGFLFGEFDGLMYALIAFMVLDYISGVLVAIAQKELSSKCRSYFLSNGAIVTKPQLQSF